MSLNHNDQYNTEIREWLEKNFEYTKFLSNQSLKNRDCPVCKSARHKKTLNNGYLNYSRCEDCDLLFMNPTIDDSNINDGFKGNDQLLLDYFNIMKKFKKFDNVNHPEPDPSEDIKLKDIYKFKKNGTLLDIGCSVGDFLHKAKYFYDVEGVEVNPITAEYSSKYFNVYTDYLENLALTKKYDVITLHQILYGVPNTVSLLQEIYKLLEDDGILYINTPNSDSYAMKLFQDKSNHIYGYTNQNVFNKKSLEILAELSGFQLEYYRTEWLDIYDIDITEFFSNKEKFIHKRNTHIENYSKHIQEEDIAQKKANLDLKDGGNYIIAILKKNV